MGLMVDSLLWVMQDFYHQQYAWGISAGLRNKSRAKLQVDVGPLPRLRLPGVRIENLRS